MIIEVPDLRKLRDMRKLTPILPNIPSMAIITSSFPNKLRVIKNESKLVLRKTIGEKLIPKVVFRPMSVILI